MISGQNVMNINDLSKTLQNVAFQFIKEQQNLPPNIAISVLKLQDKIVKNNYDTKHTKYGMLQLKQ